MLKWLRENLVASLNKYFATLLVEKKENVLATEH